MSRAGYKPLAVPMIWQAVLLVQSKTKVGKPNETTTDRAHHSGNVNAKVGLPYTLSFLPLPLTTYYLLLITYHHNSQDRRQHRQ